MGALGMLHYPMFRKFFLASVIGLFGEGIFGLASIVMIQKESGSVLAISWMVMLTMLPSVFLAPFGGVLIDQVNKATVAVVCSLVRVCSIFAVPVTIWLSIFSVEWLYVFVFLSYLAFHLLTPTTESMLKEVLTQEEYLQGVSLTQAAWQVGLLSSVLLAGLLMQYAGLPLTFMVAAVTYGISTLVFLSIRHVYRPGAGREAGTRINAGQFFADIRQGWDYLLHHKGVLFLSLAACISFPFFSAINILIAPFNYRILNGDEVTLGVVDSAVGFGSLVSAAICLSLAKSRKIPAFFIAFAALLGLSTYLFSESRHVLAAFGWYTLIGLFIGNVKVLSKTLVFKYVATEYVGRTMTTINMLSLGLATAFSFLIGYLGERDIPLAYQVVALTLLAPIVCGVLGTVYTDREAKAGQVGTGLFNASDNKTRARLSRNVIQVKSQETVKSE